MRMKVRTEGGVVSRRVVLRKRISSFTNGVVYGREQFVREVTERYYPWQIISFAQIGRKLSFQGSCLWCGLICVNLRGESKCLQGVGGLGARPF